MDGYNDVCSTTTASAFKMEVTGNAKTQKTNSLTTANTANRTIVLVLDPAETSDGSWGRPSRASSDNVGVEYPGMASSPTTRHPTQCCATSYRLVEVPQPAAANVLPADVKHAE